MAGALGLRYWLLAMNADKSLEERRPRRERCTAAGPGSLPLPHAQYKYAICDVHRAAQRTVCNVQRRSTSDALIETAAHRGSRMPFCMTRVKQSARSLGARVCGVRCAVWECGVWCVVCGACACACVCVCVCVCVSVCLSVWYFEFSHRTQDLVADD